MAARGPVARVDVHVLAPEALRAVVLETVLAADEEAAVAALKVLECSLEISTSHAAGCCRRAVLVLIIILLLLVLVIVIVIVIVFI